jgi:exosortase E/protease (VPEID-CTERM system)
MELIVQASREEVERAYEDSVDASTGAVATAYSEAAPYDGYPCAAGGASVPLHPLTKILPLRLWALGAVLTIECLAFAQIKRPWIVGTSLMPVPIAFGVALLLFGRARFMQFASSHSSVVNKKFIALHTFAVCIMALANVALLRSWFSNPELIRASIGIWTVSLLTVVLSVVAALFPPRQWTLLARSLGHAWAYAALATFAAISARDFVRLSWDMPQSKFGSSLQRITFLGVKAILDVFYANVVTFPESSVVGTSKFIIKIEGGCSGIEGVMLMLALTVIWLIFMRSELRLIRAIWLVPMALAAVWLLNLVRIAALIAIGNAGHSNLAIGGFHTEAGWVFFNVIAIGFLLAAQHVTWLRKGAAAPLSARPNEATHSAEVIYLSPFLAIIAASLISQLFSSGFEWLYPLRFIAALLVFWYFRAEYRRFDWRFGWVGPLAGIVVFVLWLWLSKLTSSGANVSSTLGQHLAALPLWQRSGWLAVRCAAMVVTVPVAEELAFRGYLARRAMASDIERVRFNQLTPIAILASAVPFGLLHGQMWFAGIVAGVVFALAARMRGRLGDAVAAHITVNLLLVVWGVATGDYSMW